MIAIPARSRIIPDFKDSSGNWVRNIGTGKDKQETVSGDKWSNINARCKVNGAEWKRRASYVGTLNLFEDFQDFTDWHINQIGYNLGYHLDADMFKKEVKAYSRDTCVLIPGSLNVFLINKMSTKGDWPRGMYYDASRDKLLVQVHHPNGTRLHLGRYSIANVDKAMKAYADAKTEAGQWWYKELLSGKYEVEPKVVEYMRTWKYTDK